MHHQPVLLFDVMDTLVYNPFNREIPDFFGMPQPSLLRQTDPAAWVDFEAGKLDEAEYFRRCFADGRTFDQAEFGRVVRDAYRWIEGTDQLLERLNRQGFEIHALSNYPIWYRAIEAKLGLSRYLEWTFVSSITGIRKPAPEAYLARRGCLTGRQTPVCSLTTARRIVTPQRRMECRQFISPMLIRCGPICCKEDWFDRQFGRSRTTDILVRRNSPTDKDVRRTLDAAGNCQKK